MSSTRREQKTREIIATAFQVWDGDLFYKTSLNTVADAMGISKTALYRYFHNKEALLEAMDEELLRRHRELCRAVLENTAGAGFVERLREYQQRVLRFFVENPSYYRFAFVRFVPNSAENAAKAGQVSSEQEALFPLELLEREFAWPRQRLELVRHYIFAGSGFLLHFWNFKKELLGFGSPEELIQADEQIVLEGMAGPELRWEAVDFEALERRALVRPEELLAPDKVFSAVAEVVAEEGLWKASLEKIARKAGMSKSGLYFYFENRDDMLWRMIDRERHRLGRITQQRMAGVESFVEQLYVYFVVFASYLYLRPEFLAVMNWFRFQRFLIKPPEESQEGMEQYVAFLDEARHGRELREDLFGSFGIVQWIHFLLVQEMNLRFYEGKLGKEGWTPIRTLFELFLFGIEGKKEGKNRRR